MLASLREVELMRSLNRIAGRSIALPLSADDIIEFHLARLLLLLKFCGTAGRIDGLTKMAKLDFFARYPDFFKVAKAAVAKDEGKSESLSPSATHIVESAMVRHHYGPWDKRYYQVLSVLEAKGLIVVAKEGNSYRITLTDLGSDRARTLSTKSSFTELVARMKDIKKTFGAMKGNKIKQLIYEVFDAEVGQRARGEVIEG
jgi:hypothetical protein